MNSSTLPDFLPDYKIVDSDWLASKVEVAWHENETGDDLIPPLKISKHKSEKWNENWQKKGFRHKYLLKPSG